LDLFILEQSFAQIYLFILINIFFVIIFFNYLTEFTNMENTTIGISYTNNMATDSLNSNSLNQKLNYNLLFLVQTHGIK